MTTGRFIMKRIFVIILILVLYVVVVQAQEMQYVNPKPGLMPKQGLVKSSNFYASRDTLQYTFSTDPVSILTSYWDYMPGSYNGLPLRIRQDGSGYTFLTYSGQRTATGLRRAFYAVINPAGVIQYNNEITAIQVVEANPTLDADPVSGKPIVSWHSNVDTDAQIENSYSFDALLYDNWGLLVDPLINVDNPITIGNTTDNVFNWPTVLIGPSPVEGNRRVYTFSNNRVSHCLPANPSENLYLSYADFNGTQLEDGTPLEWEYNTIPVLDYWNQDQLAWRRYFSTPCVGSNGNVYMLGYRTGTLADGTTGLDDSLTVFMNTNYGAGPWQMYSMYPNIAFPAPDTTGFAYCRIAAPLHTSACENADGTISFPWTISWFTPDNYWYPRNQFIQEIIFDPTNGNMTLKDVYPTGVYPNNGVPVSPWDINEDGIQDTDPDGNFVSFQSWPYMYWDETAVNNAMMFHYSNVKITKVNDYGMKAIVWSESLKAKLFNTYPDSYPELAPYSGVPEIFISVYPVSGLDGPHWSDPITLNSIESPELAGMIPDWVYPADYVEYLGLNELGNKVGRLKLMFYDDNSWGSAIIAPPVGPNDGGTVKYTSLDIAFGAGSTTGTDDPNTTPVIQPVILHQNYPNPFNPETTISFTLKQPSKIELRVYNLKGQLVKKLFSEAKPAGAHSIIWDGTDDNNRTVSSGIYTYKLSSGKFSTTKKMILLK
jgi:hypothetical protein